MSKNTKLLTATQADVDEGRAVFWVPDFRSKVYDVGLPLPADARLLCDIEVEKAGDLIPAGTTVTVVQAEIVDDKDILIGFRYAGGAGVCAFEEVRFIASPQGPPLE